MQKATQSREPLNLRAGELVEVLTAEEILATLDANGMYDNMPFMPEMLAHCGKRYRVGKRADKTCDTVQHTGLRRLTETVHLEDLRCDGACHGGCEAGCLLFFKEAWLKRADAAFVPDSALTNRPAPPPRPALINIEGLERSVRVSTANDPDGEVFRCQATELRKFTRPLGKWNYSHYVRDVLSRNFSLWTVLETLGIAAFNKLQSYRNGRRIPHLEGKLAKTPKVLLNLQPGELVRVKPNLEILKTLDTHERNRGLSYDPEMVKFCGGTYRVLRRVSTIIEEKTGRMIPMKGDCIMLEGVTCEGKYHGLCPRAIYPYWREIWLERVEGSVPVRPCASDCQPACEAAGTVGSVR